MTTGTAERKPPWAMFAILAGYMIVMFLWRVFIPANEYAVRSSQMLQISVDVMLIAALFGLKMQALGAMAADDARLPLGRKLFWFALAAGVGSLLIRFTSDAAWWTGHLMYELRPR